MRDMAKTIVFVGLLFGSALSAAQPPASGTQDGDKDGYTDADEWRFVCLFSGNEAERKTKYEAAHTDPLVPRRYLEILPMGLKNEGADPMSIESIPTENISASIQGEGTIYAGNDEFAKYDLHDDYTWSFTVITLEAVPAPGWSYAENTEQNFSDQKGPVRRFTMDGPEPDSFFAEFKKTGDFMDLDVIRDFTAFLALAKPGENPLTFDRNFADIGYEEYGSDLKRKVTLKPNGIPDVAEFKVIEVILHHPDYCKWRDNGVCFDDVAKAWRQNCARAREVLGEHASSPGAVTTMAGYAMLDLFYWGYVVQDLMQSAFSISLEFPLDGFDSEPAKELAADKSPDNDTDLNEAVWKWVSSGREITPNVIEKYVSATLGLEK